MTKTNVIHYPHLIGKEEITGENHIEVFNKYTKEAIGTVGRGTTEDIHKAVSSAREALENNTLTPVQRCDLLHAASKLFQERKETIAETVSREVGKTIRDARLEVDRGIQTFMIAAEEAKRVTGRMIPIDGQAGNENKLAFTIRQAVGVIGAIAPFNFPFNLSAHKVAPALAAGNAVVLKPAEKTPLSALLMAETLREAGFPPGFINVVNGYGHEAGEALLAHEGIDMFTFTGSSDIGQHVKSKTGIRKVTLELGSNAPTIVHHDVKDIHQAAKACVEKGVIHNGQACISVQRVYVHEEIIEDFLTEAKAVADSLIVGNPLENNTDIGPMIDEASAVRIESWVEEALNDGARIVTGHKRDRSTYYPTIITDVSSKMKVVCEEVFAPVIVIVPYGNLDEAVELANHSRFGLQVGVFTSDIDLAMRASKKLRYGGIIINDVSTFRADIMPYGGIKDSGVGKEGPRYAMEEMTDEKTVVVNIQ
ncbi:aldehyde dehydrogenase family protein [Salibacterium aidingense]|uniref:aldehyde dehydrogenase family protein n=1 Tax=Salibacterium aidingense TaxID=384933 RepID=UPI003BE02E79